MITMMMMMMVMPMANPPSLRDHVLRPVSRFYREFLFGHDDDDGDDDDDDHHHRPPPPPILPDITILVD